MNFLLTGERQVGKTTIIRTLLARRPEWRLGGFMTDTRYHDENIDPDATGGVYIHPAWQRAEQRRFTRDNLVGIRGNMTWFTGVTEAFDSYGAQLLRDTEDCTVVLMDELGFMEREAMVFQEAVLRELERDSTVLGVVKPKETPFLDRVRGVPQTVVLEVNEDNRDEIPEKLLRMLEEDIRRRGAAKG